MISDLKSIKCSCRFGDFFRIHRRLHCISASQNGTVIKDLSAGKIVEQFQVKTQDEIGRIATSLNAFSAINNQRILLSKQVAELTEAIKELMDNTGQGFFSFGSDNKVHTEYSLACTLFFNGEIGSLNALELLFKEKQDSVRDVVDLFFNGDTDPEMLEGILPSEVAVCDLILTIEYKWIRKKETSDEDKVMIILMDVIQKRKLEIMIKISNQASIINR